MGNTLNNKKANGLALLPFLVFIVVYMGAGLVYRDVPGRSGGLHYVQGQHQRKV